MYDDKKDEVKKDTVETTEDGKQETVAPVSAICDDASANAAAQIDDESEIKPVEGFFLTSQRWH